jgi:putative ABC transport system permease protein
MAVKSIFNNKVRSALTMLGIVIGVSAVIILVTLVQGMQHQVKEMYEKMGTNKISIGYYDYRIDLTDDIYDFCLQRDDLFSGVTPNTNDYKTVKYFGSDQYDICNNLEIETGRMLNYNDVKNRARVIVLGAKARDDLFNFVSPIGKTVKISGEEFVVIGVFREKYDSEKYSPDDMVLLPYTQQRLIMKNVRVSEFSARAVSADAAAEAVVELQKFLKSKLGQDWKYNVFSQQEMIDQNNQTTMMISLVLGGIAGISLIVGGIGIMNIMLVSVSERTREIGIRKAIGANRPSIISQFLIEAATISAMGGIIGILLGILISLILGKLFFHIILYPSVMIMMGAFLFSISLGIFFGIYPANRASKLNPIDALRSE